jgi:S1-C subfamily serine protease
MIKKIFATIVILLVISSFVYAKPLTLNQISEATCRVQVGNDREKSFGSGTCIAKDDSNYYILTNGHVIGNSAEGYVEFFKSGYKTREIPATVIWKAYQKNTDIDFAILSVKKEYFGD